MTAGERLRAQMDAALAGVTKASGKRLVWDERELHHLAAAARAADRVDLLQRQLDTETAGENRPAVMVKLSAELRALDRAIGDHLAHVQVGEGATKSVQHQAAVNTRWARRNQEWAAARAGGGA